MDQSALQSQLEDVLRYLPSVLGNEAYSSTYADNDEKKDDEETLDVACRKLAWFNFLQQESPIVITGVQGAGKSTFVSKLLGLEENVLICNEGRGEKIPFVIREKKGIKEPRRYLLTVNNEKNKRLPYLESVNEDAFRNILKKCDKESSSEVSRIPVVEVPACTKLDRPFLVMPGVEFGNDEKWQDLLKFILQNSNNWVLVTDETRLAHDDNQELFNELKSKNLKQEPLIVCSKSETFNDEQKTQLMNRIQDSMGQNFTNIVFTRRDDLSWKNQVIESLDDFGRMDKIDGWKNIRSVIREVAPIAKKVMESSKSDTTDRQNELETRISGLMVEFDNRVEKVKSIFNGVIEKTIGNWKVNFERDYEEKEKPLIEKFKDFILCREAKKRADYKEFIADLWDADGLKNEIDNALQQEAFRTIGIEYEKIKKEDENYFEINKGKLTFEREVTVKSRDLSLSVDMALLAYAGYHHVDGNDNVREIKDMFPQMAESNIKGTFIDDVKKNRKAAVAMVALFADGSDGSLDVLNAAMGTLGIPLSLAPQIFAGLAGIALFQKCWEMARYSAIRNLEKTENILGLMREQAVKEYKSAFDKLIKEERRFIEVRLMRILGLTEAKENAFAITRDSYRLLDACSRLKKTIAMESVNIA